MLVLVAPVMTAQRRRAAVPMLFPPCSIIQGTPGVTFSRDEGRTLTPIAQPLAGTAYTYGLAALDVPHTFLSFHSNTLSISTDDGCHWTSLGDYAADFPPTITAAEGGRAYIWSDNRQFLLRYDRRGVVALKPPGAIIGLGTDPNDGEHIRTGFSDGGLLESVDGGESWRTGGFPPSTSGINYRFTFDPSDLSHVVLGTAIDGAFVSRDGGRSWTHATGFGSSRVNAFNFAISPVDGNIVWAMAIDLGSEEKHIYRSTDGGLTYAAVVDERDGVTIVNQPVMAAHPTNPDVLYFIYGTFFQGYGTDVFRYDAATRSLTVAHNGYNDINSIAFSPGRGDIVYFGLEVENVF